MSGHRREGAQDRDAHPPFADVHHVLERREAEGRDGSVHDAVHRLVELFVARAIEQDDEELEDDEVDSELLELLVDSLLEDEDEDTDEIELELLLLDELVDSLLDEELDVLSEEEELLSDELGISAARRERLQLPGQHPPPSLFSVPRPSIGYLLPQLLHTM